MFLMEGPQKCTIDAKGRIAFPAPFRRAIPEEARGVLVLMKGLEPCLYVFTPERWEQFEKRLLGKPMEEHRRMKITRMLGMGLKRVEFDKQGRIPIPADFAAHAQLEKEAVVIEGLDRFEIWNRALLEEEMADMKDTLQEALEQTVGVYPEAAEVLTASNGGQQSEP